MTPFLKDQPIIQWTSPISLTAKEVLRERLWQRHRGNYESPIGEWFKMDIGLGLPGTAIYT